MQGLEDAGGPGESRPGRQRVRTGASAQAAHPDSGSARRSSERIAMEV
jgi:hypothetical protein